MPERSWRWLPWALNLVALWTLAFQGPIFFKGLCPPVSEHVGDFFQEWASGRNWRAGLPVYGHQQDSLHRWLGIRLTSNDKLYIKHNAHPPFSVVVSLPLAWFDYRVALVVWHAISAVSIVVAVALILRELDIRIPVWMGLPIAAMLLLSNPFRQQFNQGQWNGVLLLLITGGWLKLRRGNDAVGGAIIGIAGAIKLFPLFLLAGPFVLRRWKAVFAGVAAFALANALALATLGKQAFADYRQVVDEIRGYQSSWINFSVHGFSARIFSGPDTESFQSAGRAPQTVTLAILCCGLILAIECVRWRRVVTAADFDLSFASSTIAMLLAAPLSWDHGLILLALPLAIVSKSIFYAGGARAWAFGVALILLNLNYKLIFDKAFGVDAADGPMQSALAGVFAHAPFYCLLTIYLMQLSLRAGHQKPNEAHC